MNFGVNCGRWANCAAAYNNRGNAYQEQGKIAQAISDYAMALRLNPNYADAYGNRAIAYFYKKEYDKAWDDVRKAEELGHKVNPDVIMGLKKVLGKK